MKDMSELARIFESIREPEVSEEIIGAYIEGKLDADGCDIVDSIVSESSDLQELMSMAGSIDTQAIYDEYNLEPEDIFTPQYDGDAHAELADHVDHDAYVQEYTIEAEDADIVTPAASEEPFIDPDVTDPNIFTNDFDNPGFDDFSVGGDS